MGFIFFVNLVVFSKVWRGYLSVLGGHLGSLFGVFLDSFWGQAEAASSASGQAVAEKAYIDRFG